MDAIIVKSTLEPLYGAISNSGEIQRRPAVLTLGRQHPKQPQRNLIARTVFDVEGQVGVGYALDSDLLFSDCFLQKAKSTIAFCKKQF